MSIELENTTKTLDEVKQKHTWKVVINSEKGTDYYVQTYLEVLTIHDGIVVGKNRIIDVPMVKVKMADMLADESNFTYKDESGADKTVPIKDIPLIVAQYCDQAAVDAQAKFDAQD